MTLARVTPWTKLLSARFIDVHDEYGPNSHAVVSAFEILDETQWFRLVGESWQEPAGEDRDIAAVHSWEEALSIFDREREQNRRRYNVNGILQAPCGLIDPLFDKSPERDGWWQKAGEEVKRYTSLMSWIPDSLTREHQDLLFEHLWEYVSMLIAEIIASPESGCAYFREQLSWFHVGHFPCGWDGDWPSGRLRVF